jgi:hypothetical protein
MLLLSKLLKLERLRLQEVGWGMVLLCFSGGIDSMVADSEKAVWFSLAPSGRQIKGWVGAAEPAAWRRTRWE